MASSTQDTPDNLHSENGRPVVFIPVSGASGAGEYYRCAAIAEALLTISPNLPVHFIISAEASIYRDRRFHYHPIPGSPTHCSIQVIDYLRHPHPAAVVFDSSIRTQQLAAAKSLGAAVIAVVSRSSKRRRLLQPLKLRHIDSAWVIAAPHNHRQRRGIERLLTLGWGGRLSFGGTVLSPPCDKDLPKELAHDTYALVAPGGGGGLIDGERADKKFAEIAWRVSREGISVLFVPGPLSQVALPAASRLTAIRSLSPGGLMAAMSHARVCIVGGGSILGQGLALGKPCIPLPAGGRDQPERIAQLIHRGLLQELEDYSAAAVSAEVIRLWRDEESRTNLSCRAKSSEYTDSAAHIARDILSLSSANSVER